MISFLYKAFEQASSYRQVHPESGIQDYSVSGLNHTVCPMNVSVPDTYAYERPVEWVLCPILEWNGCRMEISAAWWNCPWRFFFHDTIMYGFIFRQSFCYFPWVDTDIRIDRPSGCEWMRDIEWDSLPHYNGNQFSPDHNAESVGPFRCHEDGRKDDGKWYQHKSSHFLFPQSYAEKMKRLRDLKVVRLDISVFDCFYTFFTDYKFFFDIKYNRFIFFLMVAWTGIRRL